MKLVEWAVCFSLKGLFHVKKLGLVKKRSLYTGFVMLGTLLNYWPFF